MEAGLVRRRRASGWRRGWSPGDERRAGGGAGRAGDERRALEAGLVAPGTSVGLEAGLVAPGTSVGERERVRERRES